MSVASIASLPDAARVWVFGADRPLDTDAEARLRAGLDAFLEGWTAHRRELAAAADVREGRFVVVALDETRVPASGCSIDALLHRIRAMEEALGVRLADAAPVWYRAADGEICCVSRGEFRRLAETGDVSAETPVFDLTLERLEALRAGRLEVAAGRSWHARLLGEAGRGHAASPPG